MKIEIAKPERFSQSGKSLLRLIQNNDMPTLDLLVRESVQNSLDAWNKQDKNVLVEFNVGNFDSMELARHLEGITNGLNERYGASKQKYIAISDSHTFGLTGDVNDPNGEDGNLPMLYKIGCCKGTEDCVGYLLECGSKSRACHCFGELGIECENDNKHSNNNCCYDD